MGYMHIDNLYKNQDILVFKECYALEKIHGTSAHIHWNGTDIKFFSGGESHERFKGLFDEQFLLSKFAEIPKPVTIYGEAYGGKQQGMSGTYGKELKFVAFDVRISENWIAVPFAAELVKSFGLEFVHYELITTDLKEIDRQRDMPSVQAKRNGIVEDKLREGVVLRPPIEFKKNNDDRIICKHKRDEFKETSTKHEVTDPEKLKVLKEAEAIANEWVTEMRLTHVLDKLPKDINIEGTATVIKAMREDVLREAKGEIVESKEALSAIGKNTAMLFKARLKKAIEPKS